MASKRIVVTTDVYEGLHRLKLPGESFSDLLRRLTANKGKLSPQVYPVPEDIDKEVARLKLQAMGVTIDTLTPEQKRYLTSWEEGT